MLLEQVESQRFGAVHQVLRQPLELFEFHLVSLALASCGTGQGCFGANRQAAFCLLRFERQCLSALAVFGWIDPELFLELLADRRFEGLIPVEAAEMEVAAARNDADFVLLIANQRQIERTAAEVHYHDRLRCRQFRKPDSFRSEDEAQRCGYRLIDDVHMLESRPLACLRSGLALNITELCWYRDDCSFDVTNPFTSTIEHRLQDDRTDVER